MSQWQFFCNVSVGSKWRIHRQVNGIYIYQHHCESLYFWRIVFHVWSLRLKELLKLNQPSRAEARMQLGTNLTKASTLSSTNSLKLKTQWYMAKMHKNNNNSKKFSLPSQYSFKKHSSSHTHGVELLVDTSTQSSIFGIKRASVALSTFIRLAGVHTCLWCVLLMLSEAPFLYY